MATPTNTTTVDSTRVLMTIAGTDVDAGDNDYTLSNPQVNLAEGFTIITGTLTNMTVKVYANVADGVFDDMTNDLFGVTELASNDNYICNVPLPLNSVVIRATQTNATNEVNFTVYAKR